MITEQLQRMSEAGTLTPARFAKSLFLAHSSAYHYYNGSTELRCNQLNLLLRELEPGPGAELLAVVLAGTGHTSIYIDAELDYDGDGDVDSHDILGRLIEATRALADEMERVNKGDTPDPGVFAATSQAVINGIVTARRCVEHIAQMRAKRHHAKAPTGAAAKGVLR